MNWLLLSRTDHQSHLPPSASTAFFEKHLDKIRYFTASSSWSTGPHIQPLNPLALGQAEYPFPVPQNLQCAWPSAPQPKPGQLGS